MVRIGVIGYGYWGPNIVRNFSACDNAKVTMVCDARRESLDKVRKSYPSIITTVDPAEIVASPECDCVAIVTPVSTHFELARRALENGKHVFVEKPFTATVADATALIELAEKKHLTITVDHTFLFTGAVRKIKELIDAGSLGKILYFDSTRVNLGLFQHDVNVIWDLAPHDFSIMLHLLHERPTAVSACGSSHFGAMADIAYVTVHFAGNCIAHFSVNWLSPVKIRTMIIGGEKKMVYWNDTIADDKLKIYDKGVEVKEREGIYKLLVEYRAGDMWAPKIEQKEALSLICADTIDSIMSNRQPLSNGVFGLEVVRILEACERSVKDRGRIVEV